MAFAHLVRIFDTFYFSLHFRFQLVYFTFGYSILQTVCEICTQKYFLINKISLYVTMKQIKFCKYLKFIVNKRLETEVRRQAMIQVLIFIYVYFKLNIFAMFVKQIFEVVNTFGINNTVIVVQ